MRYYTKEWYRMMMRLGTVDLYEPVIDKEYTDQEIEDLYEDMMEKYVDDERALYDEPPFMIDFEEAYELDPEDFDPEDFIIADIDEDGEESNMRHPASFEELLAYQDREREIELFEYENREPFDEEEAREEFREYYKDNLEEPDEDLPKWIIDTVDRRLLAMDLMPEKAYLKLMAEEKEIQDRFDLIDEEADSAIFEALEGLPEEFEQLPDDLDECDGDSVVQVNRQDGGLEIILYGWDDEGEGIYRHLDFDEAEIIEDEGLAITAEKDEDGDIESNCDLLEHEVYFEDGKLEIHLMFDNDDELKYMTFRCSFADIYAEYPEDAE